MEKYVPGRYVPAVMSVITTLFCLISLMFPRQGKGKYYQIDVPVFIKLKICFPSVFLTFFPVIFPVFYGFDFFFHSSVGENVAEGKVDIQKFVINKV